MVITDQSKLIEKIQKKYPGASVLPLSDFGRGYRDQIGVWLRGECVEPFSSKHEFGIKPSFVRWLEKKGWFLECYDFGSYHITPSWDANWIDVAHQEALKLSSGLVGESKSEAIRRWAGAMKSHLRVVR